MKKIKQSLSLMLISSLLLTSCENDKVDVSMYIYNSADTFMFSLQKGIEGHLSELGYSYNVYDAKLSQIVQNEAIVNSMDKKDSRLYVVNPVDRLSAGAIIEKANKNDYPVIFFNREPLSQDMELGRKQNKNLFYVGTDPTFEGKTQAKMLMPILGPADNLNRFYDRNEDGIIQMILIKGEIGHQDTDRRSDGALEEFAENGYKVSVLESVYCNWNRELASQSMEKIIDDYGSQIELIVSNNDDMALGAIDSLLKAGIYKEEEGFVQPFPIVGVDGTNVGLDYIRRGLLYGTIKNDGELQSEMVSELAKRILNNQEIDSSFPFPTDDGYSFYVEGNGVTKETLDQ